MVIEKLKNSEELLWINEKLTEYKDADLHCDLTSIDITDAEERLKRFAPFIMKAFPETNESQGIIESELKEINLMKEALSENIKGRMLLKMDANLPIAGSVKARGGIYEVLKHTEELALEKGLITLESDYSKLLNHKDFFKDYSVQVGSTGNLGMSIGIMSAAIGYNAIVHMSADAKEWKKNLLRSHGVTVIEYEGDYSAAVKEGRRKSDLDKKSYFVDDENSKNLFLGYAVAAKRTKYQLDSMGIKVEENNPLFVYIPCGVGGAPGGVTFGLKEIFGDKVHVFFAEPTEAPCMVLGMATEKHNEICVQDIGLSGKTHADGLAVGRASGFVGKVMEEILSGIVTVKDYRLYDYMRMLWDNENIFIEPSSCAAFHTPYLLFGTKEGKEYLSKHNLTDKLANATHIVWSTGGKLVPDDIREAYKNTYLN